MRLKDYYKILEVYPTASLQDIKKAYRTLAFKYHPDQNSNNAFAEAHFREIHEAYSILSHSDKRKKYDEERWLSGLSNRMQHQQAITPQWILGECIKLSNHIATIDTYRMSHGSLRDYILRLLSDSHMAVLQKYNDTEANKDIISHLLKATAKLKDTYMEAVADRLAILAKTDNDLLTHISTTVKQRKNEAAYNKAIPIIVVIATIALCILMYLYGRR